MSTKRPSLPDPLYLALSRKLVLLVLLMITSAIGLVVLLLQTRLSIPILAFLLTDGMLGLLAGFSIRRIIPGKALVLRILASLAFITGGLALLGWFTGWRYGIALFRAGPTRMDWWQIGQFVLAVGIAMLTLFAWQNPPAANVRTARKQSRTRRKPQKHPKRVAELPPAEPAISQTVQPASQEISTRPIQPKRKRNSHSRLKLHLSGTEEHRCPYCLELIEPDDLRGIVECEICHTQHHADCWAITGACQVPHFTA